MISTHYRPKQTSAIGMLRSVALAAFLMIAMIVMDAAFANDQQEPQNIIVEARRSGAPVWTATRTGRKLVLVGAIEDLPDSIRWNPKDLEAAVTQADRVLLPVQSRVSVGDVFRLTARFPVAGSLPKGTTSADYLPADVQQQLQEQMAARSIENWPTKSFAFLGMALLKQAGSKREEWTGLDTVRRAARKARVSAEPVGIVRGKDKVDALLAQSPSVFAPCIAAAVTAAREGPALAKMRGEAWAARDIPALMNNPLDRAMAVCWPWGDPVIGETMRAAWLRSLVEDVEPDAFIFALAPLRLLAERDGVLDRLEAQGFVIEGPAWRLSGEEMTASIEDVEGS
ncbi:MAG: TraB/GumN family protein [Porphyrobacter sp.]|jgi:hypothetical protein|nr:TraB/GumN family protein [Porphyrobacter sp.]